MAHARCLTAMGDVGPPDILDRQGDGSAVITRLCVRFGLQQSTGLHDDEHVTRRKIHSLVCDLVSNKVLDPEQRQSEEAERSSVVVV